MPAPILLDLTHTSHTRARTGIQRLARSLWGEWRECALPVCRDPYRRGWRPLERWELDTLDEARPAANRKARWPLQARLRGWAARAAGRGAAALPGGSAFLTPEIFSPSVAQTLPEIFARVDGPRAAVFPDAVALKFPELTPAKTVARYPAYLQELLKFDGVAAISEESRDALVDYWRWLGVRASPPVAAIPLGVRRPAEQAGIPAPAPGAAPTVLCVGSLEGRKNHLALLAACETLWKAGLNFELRLIGLTNPETGQPIRDRISALARAGFPVRYEGAVEDRVLEEAYRACAFTVYPSLAEGFGLPIAESLSRGRVCVCSGRGALGETARGGGCLTLERVDAPGLSEGIGRLLRGPEELAGLTAAAAARPVRTWADYARDLSAWLGELPRRP